MSAATASNGMKRFTRSPPVRLDLGRMSLSRSDLRFQRASCEALEVADQLLGAAHQVPVLQPAGGEAPLDALDEHRVLTADLVVEAHQLVDPRLVDVGPEEIVEEAVRPGRLEREHRP